MCGINGFNWKDSVTIQKMNNSITHRGPDHQGFKSFKKASLGHTRLSVIDLSMQAAQPMTSPSSSLHITYNGEIYNFQELKKQYCQNKKFNSSSDTELILAMYELFGEDCV